MRSLLPALILLILGSPADSERMALREQACLAPVEHRLGAAREAEQALATLLALGGGQDASRALAQLIGYADLLIASPEAIDVPLGSVEAPQLTPPDHEPGKTRDGFLDNRRSRDGPILR